MLEVNNIDVFYGDAQALWDVSLTVKEKEMVTMLGANGAGKSTTLRAISGLLKLKKGSISLAGVRLHQIEPYRIILHGHIPVAEPLPKPPGPPSNMRPSATRPCGRRSRRAVELAQSPRGDRVLPSEQGADAEGDQETEDSFEASQFNPKMLILTEDELIRKGEAKRIWTGNALPKGADAVIMLEYTISSVIDVVPGD
jgi:branched-chain amino acid transport system ATP-binding protein